MTIQAVLLAIQVALLAVSGAFMWLTKRNEKRLKALLAEIRAEMERLP